MTAGAAGPVAVQVDTEIVNGVMAFAQINPFFMPQRVRRGALPVPVSGF